MPEVMVTFDCKVSSKEFFTSFLLVCRAVISDPEQDQRSKSRQQEGSTSRRVPRGTNRHLHDSKYIFYVKKNLCHRQSCWSVYVINMFFFFLVLL
jgi:hypothetical protein